MMYCEKIGIHMKESTCLKRHTYHHLLEEEQENMSWFEKSSDACKHCAQGEKIYRNHIQGKKGEDMKTDRAKMKKCSKCGEEKSATKEFFWGNKNTKDGLHCWCKDCGNQAIADKKKSKKKPVKKKPSKKTIGTKQSDELVFLNKTGPVRKANIITLDFTEHEDLFADIQAAADEYYRSPEMQIMWWLVTRENPAMRGQ